MGIVGSLVTEKNEPMRAILRNAQGDEVCYHGKTASELSAHPVEFWEDGPVVISEDVFKTYELAYTDEDIHQLIIDWGVDPVSNDGVRRLCLRDILRQNYESSTGYLNASGSYTSLLRVESRGGFYKMLCDSKKLREEFVSEVLYNIYVGRVPSGETDGGWNELMEFLIVLGHNLEISELDAKWLWSLHTVSGLDTTIPDKVKRTWKYYDFLEGGFTRVNAETPGWIFEEVWKRFERDLVDCIEECAEVMRKRGSVYSTDDPYDKNLIGYIVEPDSAEEVVVRVCNVATKQLVESQRLVRILEENLVEGVWYLAPQQLREAFLSIEDRKLVYQCLMRHLLLYADEQVEEFATYDKDKNNLFIYSVVGMLFSVVAIREDEMSEEEKENACDVICYLVDDVMMKGE